MTHYIKLIFCGLFAAFFCLAGLSHFTAVDEFVKIVPPVLPFPKLIVLITGVMEIAFAIGLLWGLFRPVIRRHTGLILSAFLLAVLPANIYMAVADIPFNGKDLTPFQLWFRVFLQFPLIVLILWATGFWTKPKA